MAGEQTDDLSLSIAIDDDLIAAALASVETRPAAPTPADDDDDDDDGFDLDIDIDVDVELDEEGDGEESHALRAELSQLRTELGAASEQIRTLRAEREKTTAHIKKLRKEVLRLRAHGKRSRERIDQLEDSRKRTEQLRASADGQVKSLQEGHHKAVQQLKHLQERRRQEKDEQRRFGHSKAVLALLPVIDNLQLAMQHAAANPEAILSGVQMVLSQFQSALSSVGVQRIEAEPGTPFKPALHEAMLHVPTADVQPGHISREINAGYVLNGRLLRAARVAVAAPAPAPEQAPAPAPAQEVVLTDEEEVFVVPEELAALDASASAPPEVDEPPAEAQQPAEE